MHQKRLRLLPLLALLVMPLTTRANNIEPGKENYSAIQKTILVDGNLSDWGGATVWKDVKFLIPKNAPKQLVSFETLSGGSSIATDSVWSGPEDHSNAWAITWDADNLYIGVLVTDDYHENAANSAWNGDSLQVLFTDAARTTDTMRYNYALGGTDEALGDIVINEEKGPGGAKVAIIRDKTNKKTFYELRFPASSLAVTKFEAGMKIGVGLCINDGDQDTPGQRGWGGWGVHSIVHGKTAAEAGLVTLVAAPAGPPPSPAMEFNAEPANFITADGNLADWAGKEFRGPVSFMIPKAAPKQPVFFETLSSATTIATTSVWSGPEDQTSTFSFAWDEGNLYVGVIVTDDYHQNSNSGWNGDALQMLFTNPARDTITHQYNFGLDGTDGALGNIVINNEKGPGGEIVGIVRDTAKKKTYYEVKFPAASLDQKAFAAGMKIGVALCINDGDKDTPGQAGWSGWGPQAIVHGKDPKYAGLVTLVPAKAPSVQTFSAPQVPAGGFRAIDGDLSDWAGRPFIGPVPFQIPKAAPTKTVFFETLSGANSIATDSVWTGPEDHTSVLSFAWEKDALYIGVVVTDDYHQNNNSAWNGDSLQTLFANAARDTVTHLYNYALGGEEGALGDIIVNNEKGPGGNEIAIVRKGVTTTYELKIPPSALDLTEFKEGQQLGVGLCINDGDKDTPGQRGWSGFGVHSIVHGKTAANAGLVTLSAGGAVTVRPNLAFSVSGGNVVISFSGTLESAPSVTGAWTVVGTEAALGGKVTVPLTQAKTSSPRFYRAKQ